TSGGQPGDAARCRQIGISAYLSKPISMGLLREVIERALADAAHNGPGEARSASGLHVRPSSLITRHSLAQARRSLHVLLGEDSGGTQVLAPSLRRKQGHRATIGTPGLDGLELLGREGVALVLMDVHMRRRGGHEATRRIREEEASTDRHLPILALTAQ